MMGGDPHVTHMLPDISLHLSQGGRNGGFPGTTNQGQILPLATGDSDMEVVLQQAGNRQTPVVVPEKFPLGTKPVPAIHFRAMEGL